MKSSNLALRRDCKPGEWPVAANAPEITRALIEARAAARRARERASFAYRAIVIRDQGLRPFRVR